MTLKMFPILWINGAMKQSGRWQLKQLELTV